MDNPAAITFQFPDGVTCVGPIYFETVSLIPGDHWTLTAITGKFKDTPNLGTDGGGILERAIKDIRTLHCERSVNVRLHASDGACILETQIANHYFEIDFFQFCISRKNDPWSEL